jgi:acyl-homoserine lactone acylase PvdQ
VAISFQRSSRDRDVLWQLLFEGMATGQGGTAKAFTKLASLSPFTFNVGYANDRQIATYSAGQLPIRARGVDPGLPTNGAGGFEWRGYVKPADHPQSIDPRGGQLVNWNNKPALGFAAADDEFGYGSTYRVQLLEQGLAAHRRGGKLDLAGVTGAMNQAATQDLRDVLIFPVIKAVLDTGPAPSARDAQIVSLLDQWRRNGGSRLDRNGDGLIDDPGAPIIDAVYRRWADAALAPVLGTALADQLNTLIGRNSTPGCGFTCGWNSYIDKDLRTLLGRAVKGRYHARYCGAGDRTACRNSLWAAVDAAGNELEAAQGPNPAAWRASATAERIKFAPGLLPITIAYTNRPSGIQQVVSYSGHP